MTLLEAKGLTKSFFGVPVLHGVDLAVEPGEVLGLVGENGSGKSTSMNILGGVLQPDGGSMTLGGVPYAPRHPRHASRAGISFIHQELNLFPNLTIEENLYLDGFPFRFPFLPLIDRRWIREKTKALLAEVDLPVWPATPVSSLSPGERQMVEIAKALSGQARLIIFDEPTTSLTSREIQRLFALISKLRARRLGMIYISHILHDVLRLCDHVLVLRDGAMVGSDRAANMTPERMVTLMVGRTMEQMFPPRVEKPSATPPVLELRSVSQPGVVKGISLVVHRSEVVGVAGLLGSGRSELARIIFGLAPRQTGMILVEGRELARSPREVMQAGVAFLTEDRRLEGTLGSASISHNLALPAVESYAGGGMGVLDSTRLHAAVSDMAKSVQLKAPDIERQPINALSGGNQQKVVLGKWLMRSPKVLILDEPTRGIDVGAKYEIYRIINDLATQGAAILVISSEIEELVGLSDRILVMCHGEFSAEFNKADFDPEEILRAAMKKPVRSSP